MVKKDKRRIRKAIGYTQNARNKILGEIIASRTRGIYQNVLLEKIPGLGRTTLYEYSKKLEAEGLTEVIREGKRVKYISTDKASIDTGTVGHLLGSRFASLVFGKGIGHHAYVVSIPEGVDVIDESNAEYYRKMAEPIQFTPNITIDKAISLLSHQIGNYIIYNYIQSMNLDNYSSILRSQKLKGKGKHNRRMDNILQDEKEIHLLSDTWIRSTITSNIHRLKNKFRRVLRKYGYVPDSQTPEGREKHRLIGDHLLDREAIKVLLDALKKSYPEMYKLEKHRNDLINNRENIEWYQDRRSYLKAKHKNRIKNEN